MWKVSIYFATSKDAISEWKILRSKTKSCAIIKIYGITLSDILGLPSEFQISPNFLRLNSHISKSHLKENFMRDSTINRLLLLKKTSRQRKLFPLNLPPQPTLTRKNENENLTEKKKYLWFSRKIIIHQSELYQRLVILQPPSPQKFFTMCCKTFTESTAQVYIINSSIHTDWIQHKKLNVSKPQQVASPTNSDPTATIQNRIHQ